MIKKKQLIKELTKLRDGITQDIKDLESVSD